MFEQFKTQEVQTSDMTLEQLQAIYNAVTEEIRDLELVQIETLQEIQYRLSQSDAPMEDVAK